MLQFKTESEQQYEVDIKRNGAIDLNGAAYEWDIIKLAPNRYHVIKNHRSYQIEVVEVQSQTKTVRLKINNHHFELKGRDPLDLLLEKLGLDKVGEQAINEVKAPMPGQILEVSVAEGAAVQQGDKLVILEAMKMENVIKAPVDASVKSIQVKQGENVEKNQVLIVFE